MAVSNRKTVIYYINNDSTNTKTKEKFLKIQSYLRSEEAIKLMEGYGYRSWYGGVNEKADSTIFNNGYKSKNIRSHGDEFSMTSLF